MRQTRAQDVVGCNKRNLIRTLFQLQQSMFLENGDFSIACEISFFSTCFLLLFFFSIIKEQIQSTLLEIVTSTRVVRIF